MPSILFRISWSVMSGSMKNRTLPMGGNLPRPHFGELQLALGASHSQRSPEQQPNPRRSTVQHLTDRKTIGGFGWSGGRFRCRGWWAEPLLPSPLGAVRQQRLCRVLTTQGCWVTPSILSLLLATVHGRWDNPFAMTAGLLLVGQTRAARGLTWCPILSHSVEKKGQCRVSTQGLLRQAQLSEPLRDEADHLQDVIADLERQGEDLWARSSFTASQTV